MALGAIVAGLIVTVAQLVAERLVAPASYGADVVWFTAWASYLLVGALVVRSRPELAVGHVLVAIGVLVAISGALTTTAEWLHPGPAGAWCAWVAALLYPPVALLVAVDLPLLLPTGKLESRWGWIAGPGMLGCGMWMSGGALAPGDLPTMAVANPIGVRGLAAVTSGLQVSGGILLACAAVAGVGRLAVRWRRASGTERAALAYLVLGVVAQLTLVTVASVLDHIVVEGPQPLVRLGSAAVIAVFPASIGLAILRAGLLDVEVFLRRTLAFVLLTAGVLAAYVAVLLLVGDAVSDDTRLSTTVLVTVLAAVLLSPVRERAQRQVDRLLYGRRADPYGVLRDLDQALARATSPAEVLPVVVEVIARDLRLPHVALEVINSDHSVHAAAWGPERPVVRTLDLRCHGRQVGVLRLAARTPGEDLSSVDDRILRDLADHAGVAVAAVVLAEEAQRSRERLVNVLEEERRRIRRDLHDQLGPVLSGVLLQLDGLRRRTQGDADTAELAATVRGQVADAVVDVRRLVHDLRPPVLDELGLLMAVEQRAEVLLGDRDLEVVHGPLPRLPAAVEVAAYRILSEAFTNVLRHSRARVVRVDLHAHDDHLVLSVADDGCGMSMGHADRGPGLGLRSMRERAAELGGRLVVESGPSGTRVLSELPL
ncbi:MAG: sensor histidine kinase [Marmoricola sp.]|nr:sensor histidine kinase [Marmoricola sp.]